MLPVVMLGPEKMYLQTMYIQITHCMFALKGNGQIFFRELLSHQGINEILMTKRITFAAESGV
jgi:hypothetical protein